MSQVRDLHGLFLFIDLFSSCFYARHSLIDATLDIVVTFDIKPQDVEEIDIDMGEAGYHTICSPEEIKSNPQSVVDAQFSAPYMVATAIAKRGVWIEDFTEDAIERPEVRQLLRVTKTRVDPGIVAPDYSYGGSVTIKTKGVCHTLAGAFQKGMRFR